ncbi:hypothetical protein R3P38DRAFT_15059 [Favolaschia claudopus]|uniref:Uncharacterized protein n=1 Tax=Favolaschia claudopus TaxID=2862362 RepID=A0AAW0EGC4_9AGAR
MSYPCHDYPGPASPCCSERACWLSHPNAAYQYPSPYDFYASGASAAAFGESGSTSEYMSPSYGAAAVSPVPFSSDDFESLSPISPSCSTSSSSSSCSDAPITPYYQPVGGLPLPLLYSGLDADICDQYREGCLSPEDESLCKYEGWEEEDVTQTYSNIAIPESSMRSSAMLPEYDPTSTALWAQSDSAIASYNYFDASPTSATAPDPPVYATYPGPSSHLTAVASSIVSPQHANEYPSLHQHPVSCLSPAVLSCPPPLEVLQPQPRREIPVISLAALAAASTEVLPKSPHLDERVTSPALSPLELQSPYSPYPHPPCPCAQCAAPYSIS